MLLLSIQTSYRSAAFGKTAESKPDLETGTSLNYEMVRNFSSAIRLPNLISHTIQHMGFPEQQYIGDMVTAERAGWLWQPIGLMELNFSKDISSIPVVTPANRRGTRCARFRSENRTAPAAKLSQTHCQLNQNAPLICDISTAYRLIVVSFYYVTS